MIKKCILSCIAVLGLYFTSISQSVEQNHFNGIIVPQYMNSGTSARLATPFYAVIDGLLLNTDYKYYITFVNSSDIGNTATGAGNTLFMHSDTWNYISSPSMTAGKHDTINSMDGIIEGWFAGVNTGNSRFTAGSYVYPLVVLEQIGGSDKHRFALNDSIKVLKFGTSADTLSGTGIYGYSRAKNQNYVALYNNHNDIRPIAISPVEDDGTTIANSVGYWANNVDSKNGAWGTIIPNSLDSGIRRIEYLNNMDGNAEFTNYSTNGSWGNAKTVNPSGGSSKAIYLDSLDVPLSEPLVRFSSGSANISEGDSIYEIILEKRFSSNKPSKIKVSVLGGSATNSIDYDWNDTLTITLKNGNRTKDTFKIKIKEDNLAESVETILLKIIEIDNITTEGNGLHIINVQDNDTTIYNFKTNKIIAQENQGSVKIPVGKINGDVYNSQKVDVELKDKGKFTLSSEYSYGVNDKESISFVAGKEIDSGFVTLTINDESVDDLDDTLVFVLRPFGNESIGPDSLITVIIENDDIIPTFTFEKVQVEIDEADTNLVFRVIRSKKNNNPSDIKVTMVQQLSTAFNNNDFVFNPTARILDVPSVASDTIELVVTIKEDALFENTEQIYFKLEDLNNAKIGPINNFRVMIKEDDHKQYKINEINKMDANGELVDLDIDATVSGVVYGVNLRPLGTPEGFQFTLMDETGGLQVFSPSGNFNYTVKEGDSISVKGVLGQFSGMAQLTFIEEITLHSSNANLKMPRVIQEIKESDESDLIKFENVILMDESKWPEVPLSTNQFVDVRVKNSQGSFVLRIDSDTDIDGTLPPSGYFDLIGLGGQYDFSKPFDSLYHIAPRYKEDIILRKQKVLSLEGDSIRVLERYTDSTDDITVRISNITEPTLVELGVISSTATEILDYKFNTPYRINFTPGDTVHTFKIKIVDNGTDQSDKVLVLGFVNVPYGLIRSEDSTYLIRIIDDETTGVSEFERNLSLKVFPNPSSGLIKVSATERLLGSTVLTVQGKKVFESDLNEMDLSHLPKGIYLLQLNFSENRLVTKRILIE